MEYGARISELTAALQQLRNEQLGCIRSYLQQHVVLSAVEFDMEYMECTLIDEVKECCPMTYVTSQVGEFAVPCYILGMGIVPDRYDHNRDQIEVYIIYANDTDASTCNVEAVTPQHLLDSEYSILLSMIDDQLQLLSK